LPKPYYYGVTSGRKLTCNPQLLATAGATGNVGGANQTAPGTSAWPPANAAPNAAAFWPTCAALAAAQAQAALLPPELFFPNSQQMQRNVATAAALQFPAALFNPPVSHAQSAAAAAAAHSKQYNSIQQLSLQRQQQQEQWDQMCANFQQSQAIATFNNLNRARAEYQAKLNPQKQFEMAPPPNQGMENYNGANASMPSHSFANNNGNNRKQSMRCAVVRPMVDTKQQHEQQQPAFSMPQQSGQMPPQFDMHDPSPMSAMTNSNILPAEYNSGAATTNRQLANIFDVNFPGVYHGQTPYM
jgi:hypothetical protein